MSNRRLVLDFDALAADVLQEVGEILKKEGKDNMDRTSFGHKQYSYKVKRLRWVSKKGQSANNETGELVKTIRYKINGHTMEYGAGNARLDYAKYLEGSMKRPNITKAVDTGKQKIEAALQRKFMEHVRWNDD